MWRHGQGSQAKRRILPDLPAVVLRVHGNEIPPPRCGPVTALALLAAPNDKMAAHRRAAATEE